MVLIEEPGALMAPPEPVAAVPTRREYLVVAAVAVAVIGIYVAIAASHGVLGASRNDDWAYLRITTHLADTGEFRLDGWVNAMFIGQALVSLPVMVLFGQGILPLQMMVAVFAAVGLWATYAVARPWLGRRWTALSVACLAAGPVYGILAVSYMSDVPSYTLQMITLLVGIRAMRSAPVHLGWLAVALCVGIASFSIREFGLASGAAVAVYAVAQAWARRQRLRPVVALVGFWLIAVTALYFWRSNLPNTWPTRIDVSPAALGSAANSVWRSALTVGLFVSPVAFAASPVRLLRAMGQRLTRRTQVVLVLLTIAALATVPFRGLGLIGNHTGRRPAYSVTLPGDAPIMLPGPVWVLVLSVALYSTAVAVGLFALRVETLFRLRRSWRSGLASTAESGVHLVVLFVVLYAALLAAAVTLTGVELFDRYLLVLVPLSAALLARAGRAEQMMRSIPGRREWVALLALVTIGVVAVDASAAFDGAKWRLGQAVQARTGWEAGSIDAGYEWYGYHQTAAVEPHGAFTAPSFWRTLFAARAVCAEGSFAPSGQSAVPADDVIATVVERSLFGVEVRLVAVAGPDDCS
jgi:hypothetical protein